MKTFLFFLLALCALPTIGISQWTNNGSTTSTSFTDTQVRRGNTGVGFFDEPAYNGATNFIGLNAVAKFMVQGGVLAHRVDGQVGAFSGKWCGLGEGNPGNLLGLPNPYGLSIASNNNVGFLNLFPQNNRNDLVLGFGISGGANTNRFVLRGYSGTSASVSKDLMITNPDGATGINAEPQSTFWVDAVADDNQNRPKNIAIIDQQTFSTSNGPLPEERTRASSGMGAQANASLANAGIVVEGFRAQIGQFGNPALVPPGINNDPEVAVNLQAVKSPYGGPNANAPVDFVTSQNVNGTNEYAELTWQDLGINPNQLLSSTNCDPVTGLPIPVAESLSKFFISFRNSQNVNPFGIGNKLPVMTFQGNGRVGIGTLQPTSGSGCDPATGVIARPVLLDVNGQIVSSGTVLSSDRRLKQDIRPISDAMKTVRQLQGTTYTYRQAEFPARNFSGGNQYGFIAQDVEKVMPEAAFENSDGYYVMNYTMLIPVLTEAIKEQDAVTTQQQARIVALEQEVAELRSQFNDLRAGQQPGDLEGYRLAQNAPNPFGQNTTIRYAVPATVNNATLRVYDLTGRLLRSFPLAAGEGSVTIQAGELSDGLYLYDLSVGGRQMLERKMSVVRN
jgi:Chaperone of endosialidase